MYVFLQIVVCPQIQQNRGIFKSTRRQMKKWASFRDSVAPGRIRNISINRQHPSDPLRSVLDIPDAELDTVLHEIVESFSIIYPTEESITPPASPDPMHLLRRRLLAIYQVCSILPRCTDSFTRSTRRIPKLPPVPCAKLSFSGE